MPDYSIEENKRIIVQVCREMQVDPCVFLAIASIESGFRNTARSASGTYVGLFQLSNGYSGLSGDARLDPYKNTRAAIEGYRRNRQYVEGKLGRWENYFAYLAHQQGMGGMVYIYQNQNVQISQSKYASNMLGQARLSGCPNYPYKTVGDFLTCWKREFNTRYKKFCSEIGWQNPSWLILAFAGGLGFALYWYFKHEK